MIHEIMLFWQTSTLTDKLAIDLAMRSMQRQALELVAATPAKRTPFGNPADISDCNPENGKLKFEVTVGVPYFGKLFERSTQAKVIAQAAGGLLGRQSSWQVGSGEFPKTTEEAFSGPLPKQKTFLG